MLLVLIEISFRRASLIRAVGSMFNCKPRDHKFEPQSGDITFMDIDIK